MYNINQNQFLTCNTYLINLKLYKSLKIQTITGQCYIYSNFHCKSLNAHQDRKETLKKIKHSQICLQIKL